MYAVQIQNYDGEWITVGEATPSYPEAKQGAANVRENLPGAEVRVACVDSTAGA